MLGLSHWNAEALEGGGEVFHSGDAGDLASGGHDEAGGAGAAEVAMGGLDVDEGGLQLAAAMPTI